MRLYLFGVRGSTPAPGQDFVRFGGHTSCVAFAHDDEPFPRLVLDAGTGIRELSKLLHHEPWTGSILLGHLHWDHTQGIPFFPAGDREGSRVDLHLPADGDPADLLGRALSPPHFPITPRELQGDWRFSALEEGAREVEGFDVDVREIPHKGGRTFGFRVSDGRATVAYMSDHSPIAIGPGPHGEGEYHENALSLARDADVLLHDAQHLSTEFEARAHYGHSTVAYAVGLAEVARVRTLLLFHHDPGRTDLALDEIVASCASTAVAVSAAAQGAVYELP